MGASRKGSTPTESLLLRCSELTSLLAYSDAGKKKSPARIVRHAASWRARSDHADEATLESERRGTRNVDKREYRQRNEVEDRRAAKRKRRRDWGVELGFVSFEGPSC